MFKTASISTKVTTGIVASLLLILGTGFYLLGAAQRQELHREESARIKGLARVYLRGLRTEKDRRPGRRAGPPARDAARGRCAGERAADTLLDRQPQAQDRLGHPTGARGDRARAQPRHGARRAGRPVLALPSHRSTCGFRRGAADRGLEPHSSRQTRSQVSLQERHHGLRVSLRYGHKCDGASIMRLHPVLVEQLSSALEPSPAASSTRRDARLPAVPSKAHAVIGMRARGRPRTCGSCCGSADPSCARSRRSTSASTTTGSLASN